MPTPTTAPLQFECVVERYVDPSYPFSGLWSFACYVFGKRGGASKNDQ